MHEITRDCLVFVAEAFGNFKGLLLGTNGSNSKSKKKVTQTSSFYDVMTFHLMLNTWASPIAWITQPLADELQYSTSIRVYNWHCVLQIWFRNRIVPALLLWLKLTMKWKQNTFCWFPPASLFFYCNIERQCTVYIFVNVLYKKTPIKCMQICKKKCSVTSTSFFKCHCRWSIYIIPV